MTLLYQNLDFMRMCPIAGQGTWALCGWGIGRGQEERKEQSSFLSGLLSTLTVRLHVGSSFVCLSHDKKKKKKWLDERHCKQS